MYFLSYLNNSGSLNVVQQALSKYSTAADKGCSQTECNGDKVCEALQLGCIKEVMNKSSEAVAGDKKVSSCELLHNCSNPSDCF